MCCVMTMNCLNKQHELMQDIAISVGATYFSEKTGDDLSLINYGHIKEQFAKVANKLSSPTVFDGEIMSSSFQDLMDPQVLLEQQEQRVLVNYQLQVELQVQQEVQVQLVQQVQAEVQEHQVLQVLQVQRVLTEQVL